MHPTCPAPLSASSDKLLLACSDYLSDKPDMAELLKDRVERLVAETGKKPAALTREANLGRTMIYDIIKGKQKKLAGENIGKLAAILGVTHESLASRDDGSTIYGCTKLGHVEARGAPSRPTPATELRVSGLVTRRAAIAGTVEAGSWREVEDLDQSEARLIDVPTDDEYPNARVLVFEVAGDSMNAFAKAPLIPGSLAVCLAYEDVAHRFPPRDGMVVVIQRESDGGHFREWSIKEIELHDDHMEFHPRSTNPSHKPIIVPIDYSADSGTKVEIIAVLRRVVTETLRF